MQNGEGFGCIDLLAHLLVQSELDPVIQPVIMLILQTCPVVPSPYCSPIFPVIYPTAEPSVVLYPDLGADAAELISYVPVDFDAVQVNVRVLLRFRLRGRCS